MSVWSIKEQKFKPFSNFPKRFNQTLRKTQSKPFRLFFCVWLDCFYFSSNLLLILFFWFPFHVGVYYSPVRCVVWMCCHVFELTLPPHREIKSVNDCLFALPSLWLPPSFGSTRFWLIFSNFLRFLLDLIPHQWCLLAPDCDLFSTCQLKESHWFLLKNRSRTNMAFFTPDWNLNLSHFNLNIRLKT